MIVSFLCCTNSSIHAFGNNTRNMLKGIRLPSLHVSILYTNIAKFWLLLVFSFVTVIEEIQLKLNDLTVTMSNALSISSSEPFHDQSSL